MPYIIDAMMADGTVVEVEFDPPISYELQSAITNPGRLTEAEIEKLPKELIVNIVPPENVPAFLGFLVGPFIVSEIFRNILDDLDPQSRNFYPMKVSTGVFGGRSEKILLRDDYFLMIHPPVVDCVVVAETEFVGGRGHAAFDNGHTALEMSPDLDTTLCKSAIAGQHFWRGAEPFDHIFFCSDLFYEKISQAGLDGLSVEKKCKVI